MCVFIIVVNYSGNSVCKNFLLWWLITFRSCALCSSLSGVLLDFFMELLESHAESVDTTIPNHVVYLQVLSNDNAIMYSIIFFVMIINKRLPIGCRAETHLGLDKGLTSAQVPVLQTGNKIYVIVSKLIEHVYDLVARTGDTCHIDRVQGHK